MRDRRRLNRQVLDTGARLGAEAARALWMSGDLFAAARARPEVAARLREMVDDYSAWHWVGNVAQMHIRTPPDVERLGELRCPALVLVGALDIPEFQAASNLLHTGIVGAEKVVLDGAGHLSNMEAPARFNAALLRFLDAADA